MAYTVNIAINDITQKAFSFSSLKDFLAFAEDENKFWDEKNAMLKSIGRNSGQLGFVNAWTEIISHLKSTENEWQNWSQQDFDSKMMPQIQRWMPMLSGAWVWSGHPLVEFWMDACRLSDGTGNGFYEFLFSRKINPANLGNKEIFRGYVLAIDYQRQQVPDMKTKLSSEELAFERLRNDLLSRKNKVFSEFDSKQAELNAWKEELDKAVKGEITKFLEKAVSDVNSQSALVNSHADGWKKKRDELESTYERLLRLKKPAEYWNKRAKVLRWQAGLWSIALVASVALPLFYLHEFFILWLQGQKIPLQLNTFQGAIIFAAILSAFAVLLRALTRLTFSAFHLQRDAEEREQLTYVYLALSNEGKVNPETINLVLQSLFSRSESGLLTGESGPTMPTLGEVVTAASKLSR